MRSVLDKMVQAFKAEHNVTIEISYDGSNKLLGQMDLTRKGDLYISGDADYVEMAGKKGFVAASKPICYFVPVIMVRKGNPRKIKALSDLCAPGIKIGQGDEKSAAVGRTTVAVLTKNKIVRGAWDKNVVLVSPTVNDLANAVKLKTIDAAIVWDAIAANYPQDAEVIPIDRERNVFPEVRAAVLTFNKNREAAGAFLDFMTSPPGRQLLSSTGYSVQKP